MTTDHAGLWTNERHVSFLNWIEASFVRRMLQNKDPRLLTCAPGDRRHPPRLDRFLPDSAESTRDFDGRRRRDRTRKSNGMCGGGGKARKVSICPAGSSADQVVPQLGCGESDGAGERRAPEIAVPSGTDERDGRKGL